MNSQGKWVNRKFDFDFSVDSYPQLIDRLERTPERLEKLISGLPENTLKNIQQNNWSIQENAGHLITVEELFNGRLDDYEQNLAELRPADVEGGRTDKHRYNEQTMNDILTNFTRVRRQYISRLQKLRPSDFAKTAHHPRLDQPMRLIDMLYFQAEHDDHHLHKISKLIKQLS